MAESRRYLQNLNSSQRQVATRPDGHLLVLAGPGAGKTRALTARIGHLLIARQIPAREITAITFSRRAGAELRERVATMLASGVGKAVRSGDATDDTVRRPAVWAGTFHAFGARILRAGGARTFGRTRDFSIYDDDDTERTVRRVLNALGVRSGSTRESDTGTEANETSRTRSDVVANTIRAISLLKRTAGGLPNKATASDEMNAIFAAYEQELAQANAFDFDDLVSLSALALGADDELLGRVRARTRHLLIDEFQDTDPAQERLIAQLNAPDLCVVADPEQSIYAFRGTSPLVVERFLDTWHPATIIRLEQNYRSTRRIVAVAQRLRDASPASALAEAQSSGR
ncbi:MAG: ATP-dependent helicase, partial [Proteobacteria bacterium]|nr:ATP-dependent helicase [Pseudomonadota bacterium]